MSSSSSDVQATAFPDGTSEYKPLRSTVKHDPSKEHISETPMTWANWHKHVNWLNTIFIIMVPLCGLVSAYWVPLKLKTAIFAVIYYFNTGMGITAGRTTPNRRSKQTLTLMQATTVSGLTDHTAPLLP